MAGERSLSNSILSRRAFTLGAAKLALASIASAAVQPAWASAPALLTGAGEFRSIYLVNGRTEEKLRTIYWIEGEYIPEAMQAIDHLMRDWREDLVQPIAPRTTNILSAVQNLLETDEPFHVVSGYRSPKTNAMLRRRTGGVARKSFHVRAMAADVQLATRSVKQIQRAGKALRAGGVGIYSRSAFVHLDSGPVRDWGR